MGLSGPDSGAARAGFQRQRAVFSPICLHRRRDKSTRKGGSGRTAVRAWQKSHGLLAAKLFTKKTVRAANQVTT